MDALHLVLVESAIELVPEAISGHPSVRAYARRRGRKGTEVLLDRSFHHAAMRTLKDAHKRGRPDIAYHVLLDAVDSPLYAAGLLAIHVQTYDGMIVDLGVGVRLPRSYHRFVGLLEDLYRKGEVRGDGGNVLLRMRRMGLSDLIREISPDAALLLRERGRPSTMESVAEELASARRPLVGLGGFPAGDFSEETLGLFREQLSVGPRAYSASLISCRLIYEVERRVLDAANA